MKGVQGGEGSGNGTNQHLHQLNKLFFGQTHPLLVNRQGQLFNQNEAQKRYFQSQQQGKGNHQAIIYHISQNHAKKDPQNIDHFEHLINPQQHLQIPRGKFNHIDDLNKSVKQIMRSNEQYRSKLLSACQLKAQFQIQNAILLKEKQNFDREIEELREELEEKEQNARNMNRYVERLKQYHSKTTSGLKTEIIRLESKLEELQKSRFELENLSNENKLLHQKDAKYQIKISQLESLYSVLENDNYKAKTDLEIMMRKCEGFQRQILDMHENKIKFEEQLSKHKGKSAEDDRKIQHQGSKIRQLLESCSKLERIQEQQKQKRQISQNFLIQANRQKQRLQKFIQQLHNQLSFKNQAIQYSNRDISQLTQARAQLQSTKIINITLNNQLKQLQKKMAICQHGHSHLLHNLREVEHSNAALKHELFVQRDNSSHQLSDNVDQYQMRLSQLKEAYNNEIKKNDLQIKRLNEQKNRLQIVIIKKEEFLKQKQKIISDQIEVIVNIQAKLGENELKHNKSELDLKKILHDYQLLKESTSQDISHLQQSQRTYKFSNSQLEQQIQKLQRAIQQSNILAQSNNKTIAALNEQNRQFKQKISAYQRSQSSLKEEISNITTQNGLLCTTIDSLSEQVKVKSFKIEELSNINKEQYNQLQAIQAKILQTAQTLQSQQKGTQLITYIKDKHANIKSIQARLSSIQVERNQLERLNQQYCYYISQQKLQNQRSLQYIDKLVKQNQLVVSKLTGELSYYKRQHQRFKFSSGTIKQMKRELNILQDHCQFLLNDPKISINRFSSHINSIHKQAFRRQVEKQKSYIISVLQCSKQMKIAVQKLHLSINLLNQQLQYTFSNKNNEK